MHPGNPLITNDILGMAIYTVPATGLYTMFAEVARGHYTYASGPSDTSGGDGILIQFWHNGKPIGDTFWIAPYFVSYHLYNLTETINAFAGDTLAFSVHPNGLTNPTPPSYSLYSQAAPTHQRWPSSSALTISEASANRSCELKDIESGATPLYNCSMAPAGSAVTQPRRLGHLAECALCVCPFSVPCPS